MPSKTRDWHKARIKMELELAGFTLRQLARDNGYIGSTCVAKALSFKYPKCEKIIADAIGTLKKYKGITPADIWPSRYNTVGLSKQKTIKKRSASTIARRPISRNKRP